MQKATAGAGGRGRPLEPVGCQPWASRWCHQLNGPMPDSLGVSSTQQFFWWLSCGLHVCFRTPQALRKRPQGLDECAQCAGCGSALERTLHAALQSLGCGFCVEAKAAQGRHGPADCYVYSPMHMLVQVDGSQHTCKHMYGMPPRGQRSIDNAFNISAVKLGFHVARLHYNDAECFKAELEAAMMHACLAAGCCQRVIWYSSSYRWPTLYWQLGGYSPPTQQ